LKIIKVLHNHAHVIIGLLQKNKKKFKSNANSLPRLIVESTPPKIHMCVYHNKQKPTTQHFYQKKGEHEIF